MFDERDFNSMDYADGIGEFRMSRYRPYGLSVGIAVFFFRTLSSILPASRNSRYFSGN